MVSGELKRAFHIEHLSKSFGSKSAGNFVQVLGDVNLDIYEKEFIVILGNSGCGKSIFLKILGGIYSASGGNIEVGGADCGVEVPAQQRRRFGFVFQSNNLLPWRTAEGNLKFMLKMMRLKGERWDSRVSEMLDIVGLGDYGRVYPHELSGGMKQRVGIARALVHDPEVLILDQPLGALDAITRKMLAYEVLNIWKKTRKTVVMVTNNVDEAILLANRIFIFSDKPASVTHEIAVDIPIEERGGELAGDARFNRLREQINAIVRTSGEEGRLP